MIKSLDGNYLLEKEPTMSYHMIGDFTGLMSYDPIFMKGNLPFGDKIYKIQFEDFTLHGVLPYEDQNGLVKCHVDCVVASSSKNFLPEQILVPAPKKKEQPKNEKSSLANSITSYASRDIIIFST